MRWLAPGSTVETDRLGCLSALRETACNHQAIRTGSGPKAARVASFKWVNTTLDNIKRAIPWTYPRSALTMPNAITPVSPGVTSVGINSRR